MHRITDIPPRRYSCKIVVFIHIVVRDAGLITAGVCLLVLVLIVGFVIYVYR